jgi:hypothetical protein
LIKLPKLDSGLDARKQLAQELGYAGALLTKLAESGGKVPDSLKA